MSIRKTRLDTIVNLAILATCVILAAAAVARWTPRTVPRSVVADRIPVGGRAEALPGISYSDSASTLVLYLQSSCRYCTQSMPFYRTLSEARGRGTTKLVAVSNEEKLVTEEYLREHGVTVDYIVSYRSKVMKGTPTVVEVASDGTVRQVWEGAQQTAGERQILAAVQR